MKLLSCTIIGLLILIWAVLSAAAVARAVDPNIPSWYEHVDLMQILIGGLFVAVLGLLTRLIVKMDKKQDKQFEILDAFRKDFYTLQGEHNAMRNKCNGV